MHFLTVANHAFFTLLRDKIFLWISIAMAALILISSALGEWSLENQVSIFQNFSFVIIEFFGAALALIWSTRSLADSSHDGSIEIHLAAPLNRSSWFLGKYLGIVFSLILVDLLFMVIFGAVQYMKIGHFLDISQLTGIGVYALYWSIIAATGVFFTSISSQLIALLTTLGFWFAGLLTSSVLQILPPQSEPATRVIVTAMARYWNLNQYREVITWFDAGKMSEAVLIQVSGLLCAQGLCQIVVLVGLGCLFFEHKELNAIS